MTPKRRKKVRTKPLPERVRCPGHLAWVRGFECAVAGPLPDGTIIHLCEGRVQAAHVRKGTDAAMGEKPGDNWTVPLCARAHEQQHRVGEPMFWAMYQRDPKTLAAELWAKSPHRIKWEMKQRESA